jgi:hypothetical protein
MRRTPNNTVQIGVYKAGGGTPYVELTGAAETGYQTFQDAALSGSWVDADLVTVIIKKDETNWAVWDAVWDETNAFLLSDGGAIEQEMGSFANLDTVVIAATISDASLRDLIETEAGSIPIDQYDIAARLVSGTGDYTGITVGDLTEEATPAAGDFLFGWESGGALRKFDIGDLPGGSSGTPSSFITASFNAAAGNIYLVDLANASGDVTYTLPTSPAAGDRFSIIAVSEQTTDHLRALVNRNGHSINGTTNEQVCSINIKNQRVDWVYSGNTTYGWHADVNRIVVRQSDADPNVTAVKIFHDGYYAGSAPNSNTYGFEILDMGDSIGIGDSSEKIPSSLNILGFSPKLTSNLTLDIANELWVPAVSGQNGNMVEVGREGCWLWSANTIDNEAKPIVRSSATGPRFQHTRNIESYPGEYLLQAHAPLFWDMTSDADAKWSGEDLIALQVLVDNAPAGADRRHVEFRRCQGSVTGVVTGYYKSRGTVDSPGIVQSGDQLTILDFLGYDGNSWELSARIIPTVTGTPANGDIRSEFQFHNWNGTGVVQTFSILPNGGLRLIEQSAAAADTAGYGQIWVKNDTPNKLYFTDDAGTDHDLTAGGSSGRALLTANRTYYVRKDGNDSNSGLVDNAGGAFLTIQKAIDTVSSIDCSTYQATIQVRSGTYSESLLLRPWIGLLPPKLIGDETTPTNVVISGATSITNAVPGCTWRIGGFSVVASAYGVWAENGGILIIDGNMNHGASTFIQLVAVSQGRINVTANYTISGAAAVHAYSTYGGNVTASGRTVTISGTPNFSTAFARSLLLGTLNLASMTFSGSATGKRYDAASNAVIYTNGASTTYLPGDAAGTTATGGLYV